MNCTGFQQALADVASPSRPSADMTDHMAECASCRALFAVVTDDELAPAAPSPEVIEEITAHILTDLRPVSPIRPERHFAALFVLIFAAVAVSGLSVFRPLGIFLMGRLQAGAVVAALSVCVATAAALLTRQMIPAALQRLDPARSMILMPVALTALFFALFPMAPGPDLWKRAAICAAIGVGVSIPAAGAVFVVLRRGAAMNPRVAGSATGLFAGFVGMAVLEFHCPILEPLHIVCSHVGALTITTLGGFLASAITQVRKRPAG